MQDTPEGEGEMESVALAVEEGKEAVAEGESVGERVGVEERVKGTESEAMGLALGVVLAALEAEGRRVALRVAEAQDEGVVECEALREAVKVGEREALGVAEGQREARGEAEGLREAWDEAEGLREAWGEAEGLREAEGLGEAEGELVPSTCTAPAKRLPTPAAEVLPDVLLQSAPLRQSRHAVAPPGALLYFPAEQLLHTLCPDRLLYVPGGHTFCVALVELAPHQWPSSQDRHAAVEFCPRRALYVPAAQGVASVTPAPHQPPALQVTGALVPPAHVLPAGH